MIYRKMIDYDNLNCQYIKEHKDILQIGEELTFELKDGTTVTLQVAAINPDGDGNVALVVKNFTRTHQMNTTSTSAGGWKASEMRRWLNEEFIDLLPDELVEIIEPRTLPDCSCTDRLWLLSRMEVFGEPADTKDIGPHFELYQTDTDRAKSDIDGSASYWWLRSPSTGYTYNFWFVNTSGAGNINYNSATYSYGVAWGIMI